MVNYSRHLMEEKKKAIKTVYGRRAFTEALRMERM